MQHATPGEAATIAHDAVALAHGHVVRLRLVSAQMVLLQRAGRIASHHASIGEEAAVVGAVLGARDADWIFPGPREWGAALVRGMPLADYVHHAFGSRAARAKGHAPPDSVASRKARIGPPSGIRGAHLPQAVGAAWAAKIAKHDVATIALLGAEEASSGDFHDAMNFAGVFTAPCVFVLRVHEEAGVDVAERAAAYGLASARVDGMDVLAVQAIVREAVERAAAGKGATMVAAVTRPVTSLDDATLASDAVLRAAGDEHPVDDAFVREVRAEIEAAIASAESAGPPDASTLFDDVYAVPPPELAMQKRENVTWRR